MGKKTSRPAAGECTYMKEGSESARNLNDFRDYYYLYCQGQHHAAGGVPDNLPAFDSAGEPERSDHSQPVGPSR